MNQDCLKQKNGGTKKIKYAIFNLMLLCCFFAFAMVGGVVKAASGDGYEIYQSNYSGNSNNYDDFYSTKYNPGYYVQTRGKALSDVVSFKVVTTVNNIASADAVTGLVVFESGHTESVEGKNYDSYKKNDDGVWENQTGTSFAAGKVAMTYSGGSSSCNVDFATAAAKSTDLKANAAASAFYSLMCVTESVDVANNQTTLTIYYAYTMRSNGYGVKTLHLALYNDSAYDDAGNLIEKPVEINNVQISFIAARPISDYMKDGADADSDANDGFLWDTTSDATCDARQTFTDEFGNVGNKICVEYVNGGKTTEARPLNIYIPKEVAYSHDNMLSSVYKANGVDLIDNVITEIQKQSIYGVNTFQNSDKAGNIKYYYWDFNLFSSYSAADADGDGKIEYDETTYTATGAGLNDVIDPTKEYKIEISIDASGNYVFTIKDVFGNTFTSVGKEINDVAKTTVIIDYTNIVVNDTDSLNIMDNTCWGWYNGDKDEDSLTCDDLVRTGTSWEYDWYLIVGDKIDFEQMKKTDATVEAHTFQRVQIGNGVWDSTSTAVKKQPLGNVDSNVDYAKYHSDDVKIWRVKNVAEDGADATNVSHEINSGITFTKGTYTTGEIKNKITFTVPYNGRYRIKITDNYGNTTDTLTGERKNPKVEVSVIDATTPVVSTELTGTTPTAYVETYGYVNGGGHKTNQTPTDAQINGATAGAPYYIPGSGDTGYVDYYSTAYYNAYGDDVFDYEDALTYAKIAFVDQVYYYDGTNAEPKIFTGTATTKYEVSFSYSGQYRDTASTNGLDSNRNTTSTDAYGGSNNLHEFIIAQNITSFTGGVQLQVAETAYVSNYDYTKLNSGTRTNYVNTSTEYLDSDNFSGYLKIKFIAGGTPVCVIEEADVSENQTCFEQINKMIDDVEEFTMEFSTVDFKGNASNAVSVKVVVVDTTAPGLFVDDDYHKYTTDQNTAGVGVDGNILYTNTITECRLEIANNIQAKTDLLKCYMLLSKTNAREYYFKDNNSHTNEYDVLTNAGHQYYDKSAASGNADLTATSDDFYWNKIKLEVCESDLSYKIGTDGCAAGDFKLIEDSNTPVLSKSGNHLLRITIEDHWNSLKGTLPSTQHSSNNVLTIYVNYYVNPRTLLIEPLANEKMYGEADPEFDYCVYVNNNQYTFNLDEYFFESNFINTNFTNIYCSRNVYAEIKDGTGEEHNTYKATSTSGSNYNYKAFTKASLSNGADHIKVNNTYVEIKAADNVYKQTGYAQNNTGSFLNVSGEYYPILSGYMYEDKSCTKSGSAYLKITVGTSVSCEEIKANQRYNKKYEKDTTGAASGKFVRVNINDANDALAANANINNSDAMVKITASTRNEIQGALTRVEAYCYNSYDASKTALENPCTETQINAGKFRNDNVGYYHIVLGNLSIKEGTGTSYNDDYVIRINTNYYAQDADVVGAGSVYDGKKGYTATTTPAKDAEGKLVDHGVKTESNVVFTIRQAVLTVTANGSSKYYGEMDPYSNVWNNKTTAVNNSATGYLGGYTIHGFQNGDDDTGNGTLGITNKYILEGTLRREVGEHVGVYKICNINANPASVDATKCTNAEPTRSADTPTVNDPTGYDGANYYYKDYDKSEVDLYTAGGVPTSDAALSILQNKDIYGNADGRKLNTSTRNYAILFISNNVNINATDIVIQPGVNQGKEYAKTEYKNPLWELVIYGETADIKTHASTDNFSGYTATIAKETNARTATHGTDPYDKASDNTTVESEVYYSRRKTAHDVTYEYVYTLTSTDLATKYKYDEVNKFYYEDSDGTYIYKFGHYFVPASGNKITVSGELVNQTYKLFGNGDGTGFTLVREGTVGSSAVGWYYYEEVDNFTVDNTTTPATNIYTIKANDRGNKCTITNGASEGAVGSVTLGGSVDCRNYNVRYTDIAPTTTDANSNNVLDTGDKLTTTEGTRVEYRPDGFKMCTDASYTSPCSTATTGSDNDNVVDAAENKRINFEIFKRKIVIGFIDENYIFTYGERYKFYDGGRRSFADANATTSTYEYNENSSGILNIKDSTSEGDIFLCYSDLEGEYLVNCTSNPDYGTTAGDTWTSIGLKFYLHSAVSANNLYYGNDDTDLAMPAGKYYVYAEIGQTGTANDSLIKQNYDFEYKGGTLTIKPKVTSVELTGYTKEYGTDDYVNYGLGTDYSGYTLYGANKMSDDSYLSGDTLISNSLPTTNVHGNAYGFIVEGLDVNDTIAQNFNGRPKRAASAGVTDSTYEKVGHYKISVNNIGTIIDTRVAASGTISTTKALTGFTVGTNTDGYTSDITGSTPNGFVFVNDGVTSNGVNYDISYSLTNNEGAYLFVTPAKLNITVTPNQTKMYGCAYYEVITDPSAYYANYSYQYGYNVNGYNASNATTVACYESSTNDADNRAVDLAYQYKVTGDKVNGNYTITTNESGEQVVKNDAGTTVNTVLTDGRLYRIIKNTTTNNYTYSSATQALVGSTYQGQSVGVYTITLGNVDVATNGNAMCDAFNNPSVEGTVACKDYVINYYGNSTSLHNDVADNDDSTGKSHTYYDDEEYDVSKLKLYMLNYTAGTNDNPGEYILIDGKYVNINKMQKYSSSGGTGDTHVYVNNYVLASSLQKYKKVAQYTKDSCKSGADCYIYLNGGYKALNSSDVTNNLYNADKTTKNPSAAYDSAYIDTDSTSGVKLIKLSTLQTYKNNGTGDALFKTDSTGSYVKINNQFVDLASLKKYTESSGIYTESLSGTHVLIYELKEISSLTRYNLNATAADATYKEATGNVNTTNLYVFVNGSYVPYNSLTITDGKATLNSANTTQTGLTKALIGDVNFTIIARKVYVHTEFNIKAFGEDDPIEYISCAEVNAAYDRSDCAELYTASNSEFEDSDGTLPDRLVLGVSMYYAVQNSLAKYPWTAWTDNGADATQKAYSDIQYDVVRGTVERYRTTGDRGKEDVAGKYTFDFGGVTNIGTINGDNYMLVHVTNMDTTDGNGMENTYVKNSSGELVKLSTLMYEDEACTYGQDYCAYVGGSPKKLKDFKLSVNSNDQVVESGGTEKSISLIKKYKSNGEEIKYWHVGFYTVEKTDEARMNQLSIWWSDAERPFNEDYDGFKDTAREYVSPDTWYFAGKVEIYFEIIKRTIYLYAVDTEKIYGEADKYKDFLVAICSNADGYIVDSNGVRCKNEENLSSGGIDAYGLSNQDKSTYLETKDGKQYMKQDTIRGIVASSHDYMFRGEVGSSSGRFADYFGIYFRRDEGENAGYYTVTACATQNHTSDCTDLSVSDDVIAATKYKGDNYKIIEISGVLTINPRQIQVTPIEGQGFQYGNYTDDGAMPNITFKETHQHDNDTDSTDGLDATGNGLVNKMYLHTGATKVTEITNGNEFEISSVTYAIRGYNVVNKSTGGVVGEVSIDKDGNKSVSVDGTSYTIIQYSRCLISISGLKKVCINDAQNQNISETEAKTYTYDAVDYTDVLSTKTHTEITGGSASATVGTTVGNAANQSYYMYNVYKDDYSDPTKFYTRKESTATRSALNLTYGANTNLRYSRDAGEYTINKGDLAISSSVFAATTYYVRIMQSNVFTKSGETYSAYTLPADTKLNDALKTGEFYVRYGREGNYKYALITLAKRYGRTVNESTHVTEWKQNNDGDYLQITTAAGEFLNYALKEALGAADVKFNITMAGLTVTPIQNQYKIYGEEDPEIKFTVETQYTVENTHYQAYSSNIVYICSDASTCYSQSDAGYTAQRFAAKNGSQNNNGDFILLPKGWIVKLNSYAYKEEVAANKTNNLDYGLNTVSNKYPGTTATQTQALSSITHYDKYTSYKSTNMTTSDILIGKLYTQKGDDASGAKDQNVGNKNIVNTNGMKVGINNLGGTNKNYDLSFTTGVIFRIIPRPVNVQIQNIVKTYGQATDRESCDNNYVSNDDCVVGEGLLLADDYDGTAGIGINEDANDNLLGNNFKILDKKVGDTNGQATVEGVTVDYGTETDYTKINMPRTVTAELASSDPNYAYLTVTGGKYYTETGNQEKKNSALNIEVTRFTLTDDVDHNIARDSDTCLATGDTHGCEDVGEYFLKFTVTTSGKTANADVDDGYNNRYWGYNPNYYVIIYNNFVTSDWSASESAYKAIKTANDGVYYGAEIKSSSIGQTTTVYDGAYTNNANPGPSATLKIRKRSIQMVVETIDTYEYTQSATGKYLKLGEDSATIDSGKRIVAGSNNSVYHLITDGNRYNVAGGKYVQSKTGTHLCTYAAANSNSNCHEIKAADRYDREAILNGEKYTIEQYMDVPELPTIGNGIYDDTSKSITHHTTYDYITWYDEPRQVRTTDKLVGKAGLCQTNKSLTNPNKYNELRDDVCEGLKYFESADNNPNKKGSANYFDTSANGYYIITRDISRLYISNTGGNPTHVFEQNNYTTEFVNGILQIDVDETAPVISVDKEFIKYDANNGKYLGHPDTALSSTTNNPLNFLEAAKMKTNYCSTVTTTGTWDNNVFTRTICSKDGTAIVFTYENGSNEGEIGKDNFLELKDMFGLHSYDPGIIRNGIPEPAKRYDARWYIVIQSDFEQEKVGDYTVFIYAQDNAGNISMATTATLRIVDETKPISGTLNLYDAEVICLAGKDCNDANNWVVKNTVYLPINTISQAAIDDANDYVDEHAGLGLKKINTGAKWLYKGNGSYVRNDVYGTYYQIEPNTPAMAVAHDGWTNSTEGVHLTVLGGYDNSQRYLDISQYTDRYSVTYTGDVPTQMTVAANGTYLLRGTMIKVDNLTKYRLLCLSGEDETTPCTTSDLYIPDIAGEYIRYKGQFIKYKEVTANNQKILFEYDATNKKYTPLDADTADANLYLLDGEFYLIPDTKYKIVDGDYVRDANGTYVEIGQWSNYYSRDGGYSWAEFNVDSYDVISKLALGQDGQRLIMTKAIDNGYTFTSVSVNKKHLTASYAKKVACGVDNQDICIEWQKVKTETHADEQYTTKVENYNISDWAAYTTGKTTSWEATSDMKYAYLDTVIPHISINDSFIKVYEYGCGTNCKTNYNELFGKTSDGYLYSLDEMTQYNKVSEGVYSKVGKGDYVIVNGYPIAIATSELYTKSGTTFNLVGSYVKGTSGYYIYLGASKTSDADKITIDTLITGKIGNRLSGTKNGASALNAYDDLALSMATITMPSSTAANGTKEVAANLKNNTSAKESGVGNNASIFQGKAYEEWLFGGDADTTDALTSVIDDKYTTVLIYAIADDHGVTPKPTISGGNTYLGAAGYYKFNIVKSGTKYLVNKCYSASNVLESDDWNGAGGATCTETTGTIQYDTMQAAINAVTKVFEDNGSGGNAINFNGIDVSFTIDFRVSDYAGNESYYERKAILTTSFTRVVHGVVNGAVAGSEINIELDQNEDPSVALSGFEIATADGKNLRFDEKITQTIYYNGTVIAENEDYDVTALSNLDTSVPGAYKIVYSIARREGTSYVQGNSVELMVTVKPDVASINRSNIDYKQIIISAFIASSAILVLAYIYMENKKKKI